MNNLGYPLESRNRAVAFIERGEELFNHPKKYKDQENGYKVFKKGLQFMIEYGKAERDPDVFKMLKKKLDYWMDRARYMESIVYPPGAPKGLKIVDQNIQSPTSDLNKDKDPHSLMKSQLLGGASPMNKKPEKIAQEDIYSDKLANCVMAALVTEKPNINWDDIAGLEQAKTALQEAVIYPIKFPHLFVGMRTPWKGILLYGPPGTGKTFLAKACATEANATFYAISSADVMSRYVGESENIARKNKPAIIFIDEIDSLLSARSDDENEATRRVKTEFLVQMQGVGNDDSGILVLGATNIPWALDAAVRRRFEKRIYIPLPDLFARRFLLTKQLEMNSTALESDDMEYLTLQTEGYSSSDLIVLVRDACYEPIRQAQNARSFKVIDKLSDGKPVYQPCPPSDPQGISMVLFDVPGPQLRLRPVCYDDFEIALHKTKPSVSAQDLVKQEKFTHEFGIDQ